MTTAAAYTSLSRLLDYPWDKELLQWDHREVTAFLALEGIDVSIAPFADLVDRSTLAALQEEYVALFDFNPAAAPYLGHHLYGDNQKKGPYLIRLKRGFTRHGFTPAVNELPDHLPLLLAFLAHLSAEGKEEERRAFIDEAELVQGMAKLAASFAAETPWKGVVTAALEVITADRAAGEAASDASAE